MSVTVIYVMRGGVFQWNNWEESREQFRPGCSYQYLPWDEGRFDLGVYRSAAKQAKTPYVCCVNSASIILADNWLAKLMAPFTTPQASDCREVGLAGCTASAESFYTNAEQRFNWGFNWVRRWFFPPFPNFHIRTTGFVMRRELLLELFPHWFPTKRHCYLFESGYDSLTRRIHARGLRAVVVGRDGVARDLDFYSTRTFRSGDQENLLIADKQTCRYQNGTQQERTMLADAAWGQ